MIHILFLFSVALAWALTITHGLYILACIRKLELQYNRVLYIFLISISWLIVVYFNKINF